MWYMIVAYGDQLGRRASSLDDLLGEEPDRPGGRLSHVEHFASSCMFNRETCSHGNVSHIAPTEKEGTGPDGDPGPRGTNPPEDELMTTLIVVFAVHSPKT